MSADSPRRSGGRVNRQGGGAVSGNGGGLVVAPQPVTDPSIIDSVTGFINDVVPQAYTSTLPGDCKETITWARFESADINDPAFFPDCTSDTVLPLILILGYNTGVQVWAIPANGEATQVLSWSQGSVRTLRILPSPLSNLARNSDPYASKRPLVAICDSAGPGPPFCSVCFISLKTGDQVKSIKFNKNPVCDVYANRRSVIVTFPERIAVFDACSLEDRLLSVTTCYPSPGPNVNPVALGSRWLAYAEKKLIAWQRSSGGVGGGGAQSYTATVLQAAQTLGRGLRGLSETVASSLAGPRSHTVGTMGLLGSSPPTANGVDHSSPGIVTVLDLEASSNKSNSFDEGHPGNSVASDAVIAHFIAHNEAIVALEFDPSGTLLLTADRRGHDFHVFRLQPHPSGSSLAAVHHLYVLHRGDTTAKVQDVSFSYDSRWVAVSTMRGTTHVFPLTPYGGPVGFRTHGSPLVVNRLSRFHRSAGLSADGRSSPVPSPESPPCLPAGPHANPRLPPYPHPTVQSPLSQLRQSPHPPLPPTGALDISLRVCAIFASPRAWLLDSQTTHPRDGPRDSSKVLRRPVDSLFVMAHHGNLVQYDLDPKPITVGPREKICDDTQIELEVEAKAQWPLQRSSHSAEVLPPLSPSNLLLCGPELRMPSVELETNGQLEERWLSQVEIVTHAGPHRRLWMGPQITFKTYTNTTSGTNVLLQDVEAVEVGTVPVSRPARSNPVNMPSGGRPIVPVLIESGSGSSYEQSPHLLEVYGADSGDAEHWGGHGDSRLREDLADAMLESPGAPSREKGKRRYCGLVGGEGGGGDGGEGRGDGLGEGRGRGRVSPIRRVVNPGGAEITVKSSAEADLHLIEEADSLSSLDHGKSLVQSLGQGLGLADSHWEAIAIPASAPLIPVPLDPLDSDPHDPTPDGQRCQPTRQLVTTIAASRLQRLPVELAQNPQPPQPTNQVRSTKPTQDTQAHPPKPIKPTDKMEEPANVLKQTVASEVEVSQNFVELESIESVLKAVAEESVVEKELAGRKKSKSKAGVGGSYKKGNTPEREMQCQKEGSVEKETDSEKVTNYSETLSSRKKIKKGKELVKEMELFDNNINCGLVTSSQHEETLSISTNSDKVKDMPKSVEVAELALGKKGKHAEYPQENAHDENFKPLSKGANRKAPSPQKEIIETKIMERSLVSPEKVPKDDVHVSTSSKKSKKKSQRETLKKDAVDIEIKSRDQDSTSQTENSDCINCIVVESVSLAEEHTDQQVSQSTLDSESETKAEIIVEAEFEDSTRQTHLLTDKSISDMESSKPISQIQTSSKANKKLSKSRQNSREESPIKDECQSEGSVIKVNSNVTSKQSKQAIEIEKMAKEKSVDSLNVSEIKESAATGKTKKGNKLKDNESIVNKTETFKICEEEQKDSVCDYTSCALKNENKEAKLQVSVDICDKPSVVDNMVNASLIQVPVKSGKKGSKLPKGKPDDAEINNAKPKAEIVESASPSETVVSSVWSIQSNVDNVEDSQMFPALPNKTSIKGWGNISEATPIVDDKCPVVVKIKPDKGIIDLGSPTGEVVEVSKSKRGWELPSSINSHEMDIEKLTFEDLEAIVDAACKEEETKAEESCLKENKKGKKSDPNSVSSSPKTKGKENVVDEIIGGGEDSVEIIEVPKPEEPVKVPEKTLSTPNRSSKAHRKKRR